MPTLMARGATWLADKLQDAAGRSITLHWRNKTLSVTGTVTRMEYEVTDESGVTTLLESWDWTFTASELVIDGETVRPTKGYQIRDGANRYDVMPVGSKPPAEPLDSHETLLVVHSKKVSS